MIRTSHLWRTPFPNVLRLARFLHVRIPRNPHELRAQMALIGKVAKAANMVKTPRVRVPREALAEGAS